MKLIRLKLNSSFRSLHAGFETHFLRDFDFDKKEQFNPYCLVGKNGSGKSNVLEVLAAIFYHIEAIHVDTPDGFYVDDEHPDGFDEIKASPDAFELEYFIHVNQEGMQRIRIIKEIGRAPQIYKEDVLQEHLHVKSVLPDYVVGYSSGSNEVLSLPFYKMRFIHFDAYRNRLIKEVDYGIPYGRMAYFDSSYSQAIVLCNFLFQGDEFLQPFRSSVGIKEVKTFRLIITEHIIKEDYVEDGYEEGYFEDEEYSLTALLRNKNDKNLGIIDRLIKCSTGQHVDKSKNVLILDYFMSDATKSAFRHHFYSSLELFEAFQMLLTLNYFNVDSETKWLFYHSGSIYVNETIPTVAAKDRVFRFNEFYVKKEGLDEPVLLKSLSDGEHQYLHTVGLSLLYRNTSTLFLLDEPETHFNPKWRAEFISTLRKCLDSQTATITPEVLITSHSPFVVSDTHKEQVLVFEKEGGMVTYSYPTFNTFGASTDLITLHVFKKKESIADVALKQLEALKKQIEDNEIDKQAALKMLIEFGDSFEKMLVIKALRLKEEPK